MNGLPVIAIDPGHNCSPDIGASYEHYSEDKIVLAVAQQLKEICKQKGIRAIDCLPETVQSVADSLRQRCDRSNKNGATIYISIHCNKATPTSGSRGCETYAKSTAGKAVAANINRELSKLGFKNRGVKETLDGRAVPYVIRNTSAIAVLVEICFLDAAEDVSILNQKGVKAIAQALFDGLTHGMDFDPKSDDFNNDPVIVQPRSLLVDAATWYKGLPHQAAALRDLESDLSADRLAKFRSAYSPAVVKAKIPIVSPTPVRKVGTVDDWIKNGDGSTSGVDGLSDQIIRAMGDTELTELTEFIHPRFVPGNNCDPYFHPELCKKIKGVLHKNSKLLMQCNSGYRSPVRQLVLRRFYELGINGITAAARVGTGNHEDGTALDLQNWEQWKPILIADGWHWQGMSDKWHFDIDIDNNVPKSAIAAYQKLANQYGDKLLVDGVWGADTERSMLNAPASGW